MSDRNAEQVDPAFARRWWKTLMANAVALVEDASLLASHGSAGRAQSLVVLAMEELAKARWIYEAAEWEWTAPLGIHGQQSRAAERIDVPAGLRSTRHSHAAKLQVAEQFASGLSGFWNPSRRIEYYNLADLDTFEGAARQLNLNKQAGFYVDRSSTVLTSPLDVPKDGVQADIQRAAKVIQMHLIEDHTRQQDAADRSLIDSVENLHWAVMPYSDPELFGDFMGRADGDLGAAVDGDDG